MCASFTCFFVISFIIGMFAIRANAVIMRV